MSNLSKKSFAQPDELKTPPKTNAAVVKLGNITASKLTLEPGWKWSECVQPAVGGHSCQAGHVGVIIQGTLKCVHDDGSEIEVSAGDAYYFAPGHDGWVVGDDETLPVVLAFQCLLPAHRCATTKLWRAHALSYFAAKSCD